MLITLLWFDVLFCVTSRLCPCLLPYYGFDVLFYVTSRLCSCLLPYYGLMYYSVSNPGCVHAYYLIMV